MDQLRLTSDYRATKNSSLTLKLSEAASLDVDGAAHLDGHLSVELAQRFKPKKGTVYTLLSADKIKGEFANVGEEIETSNGARFQVNYTKSAVTLTAL